MYLFVSRGVGASDVATWIMRAFPKNVHLELQNVLGQKSISKNVHLQLQNVLGHESISEKGAPPTAKCGPEGPQDLVCPPKGVEECRQKREDDEAKKQRRL